MVDIKAPGLVRGFFVECFCIVVAVILESRSPGSVVIKKENNGYCNTPHRQTFQYDLYFYRRPTTQTVGPETSSGRRAFFIVFLCHPVASLYGFSLLLLSSPSVFVGDLSFRKRTTTANNGFPNAPRRTLAG